MHVNLIFGGADWSESAVRLSCFLLCVFPCRFLSPGSSSSSCFSHLSTSKILISFVLTLGDICPLQISLILFTDLFLLSGYLFYFPLVLPPGFDSFFKGLVLYRQVRPLRSYSLPISCFLFPVFCG